MNRVTRSGALGLALVVGLCACGDDGGTTPEMDAGVDAGPPTRIEDVPISAEVAQDGLSANVEAIRDERGMWHIYGDNLEDVMRAQGYLQARDRMGQMDFLRRAAGGRLSELGGSLIPSLVELDQEARFAGHIRNAERIAETLSAEQRGLLEAFTAGVNLRRTELLEGEAELPRGVAAFYPIDVAPEVLPEWTVVDTLTIARFQSASLSFDGLGDASRSTALAAWQANFTSDAGDPRVARLAGAFHDFWTFRPARFVSHLEGLDEEFASALLPPHVRPQPDRFTRIAPALRQLRAVADFGDRLERHFALLGDETRGSNSWAVAGEHTASGNALLANDPHLSLSGPSLFWQAHLNTKRAGGTLNSGGQMIAGTNVNLLGWNDALAWGLTTSGYDVSDVYLEHITLVDGGPDTVEFDGEQVAIETVTEQIRLDNGSVQDFVLELVPHHGFIVPGSREDVGEGMQTAVSLAWTGNDPSVESQAFFDLYEARNEEDARAAWSHFEVGNQTLVLGLQGGEVLYLSDVRIPTRDPRALDYDPTTYEGDNPCHLLDGRGDHEWGDDLASNLIPASANPARGFVATANADPSGDTFDGNPFDASRYIGCDYADGFRIARITERLEELVTRGDVTADDMSALQNDAQSPFGRALSPIWITELDRALAEVDAPGTHADLSAAVAGVDRGLLQRARDLLGAWSFDTPAALEGSPSAEEIADSVATTLFNVALGRAAELIFDDEMDWANDGEFNGNPPHRGGIRTPLYLAFANPAQLYGWDADAEELVYWDDISTEAVETRGDRVVRAIVAADAWLVERLGADEDEWRWGKLHTLRLNALIPTSALGLGDPLSIPERGDETFPLGFPRHGDRGVVDASNFSAYAESYDPSRDVNSFRYGSGPQQRLVVEVAASGPIVRNAMPGGNSEDPDSPYFRNEMELWRMNQTAAVPWTETEVLAAAAEHIRFVPGT